MLGRDFRNHRWKLVLISVLAITVLTALAVAVMVLQRDDRASADEPQAKETLASLGIDLTHCPKVEPEELPPNALAGATNAALAYFEDVEDAEGQYAVSANRGLDGEFFRHNCPELSPERARLLQRRSVIVSLEWPKKFPSASLSQHTVFVAKFEGEYRVWWMWH